MTRAKLIALSVLLAFGCSCQKKRQAEDSALVQGYKLIDAQRTDEAILLLEAESSKLKLDDPEYTRYRVALASAYAHKAGFKVQKFSKLLQVGSIKIDFKMKVDNKAKSNADAVDQFLIGLSRVLRGLAGVSAAYTSIPTLSKEEERYLLHAIKVLDGLDGTQLRPGDAVYRAVLRGIYLKHYISTHLFREQAEGETLSLGSCSVDFNKFSPAVLAVSKIGIAIFDDMIIAQPKKAVEYAKTRQRIADVASDLTAISTFASLLDEASLMMAKNTFVQTGLRNLLKCSDDNTPVISSPASSSGEQ